MGSRFFVAGSVFYLKLYLTGRVLLPAFSIATVLVLSKTGCFVLPGCLVLPRMRVLSVAGSVFYVAGLVLFVAAMLAKTDEGREVESRCFVLPDLSGQNCAGISVVEQSSARSYRFHVRACTPGVWGGLLG